MTQTLATTTLQALRIVLISPGTNGAAASARTSVPPRATPSGWVAMLCELVAACLPNSAGSAESYLVNWFGSVAAPALEAATPTNDPLLARRELLNRGLAGVLTRVQHVDPGRLAGLDFGISFDPALQPRYALSVTRPVLADARDDAALDLHGQVTYDKAGQTDVDLGLRYHSRWRDRVVSVGLQGALEDRWLAGLQRFSLGAEGRLSSLEVRADLHDDVPEQAPSDRIAARKLDGYDLKVDAPVPFLSGARLHAGRSWKIAVNSETATTADRIGLSLNPRLVLEIATDTHSEPEERTWSTQLRWRVNLGG